MEDKRTAARDVRNESMGKGNDKEGEEVGERQRREAGRRLSTMGEMGTGHG